MLGNSSKNLTTDPVPVVESTVSVSVIGVSKSSGCVATVGRDGKSGYGIGIGVGVEGGAIVKSSFNTSEKVTSSSSSSSAKNNPNYQAYHTCEKSAAYVTAIRSEAIELKESIRASGTLIKALRKLTTLNWVMCYER